MKNDPIPAEVRREYVKRVEEAATKAETKRIIKEMLDAYPEYAERFDRIYGSGQGRRRAAAIKTSTTKERESADAKIAEMRSKEKAQCPYCLKEFATSKMQVDHILSLLRGGKHSAENVTLACIECNSRKGVRTIGVDFFPFAENKTPGRARGTDIYPEVKKAMA